MADQKNHSVTAFISLGSNLGDRGQTIQNAIDLLRQTPGITELNVSRFLETVPQGGPLEQPSYLNAAAVMQCSLSAEQFLERLMQIEQKLGRQRVQRWSARTIDLDILFFGDQIIHQPNLIVPHPRILNRSFVLEPLLELAPDWIHPVFQKTVREMEEETRLHPLIPRKIAVAGIIGIGKTTLARNLHQILGGTLICEEYDKNPYLPRQLQGEKDAALASELFFLFSRSRQLQKDLYEPLEFVITDYVFDKNRIFARMNLDDSQFRVYQDIETVVLPEILKPDTLIYLTDTVEHCIERIHNRGRSFEQRISSGWLTRLKKAYDDMVVHWSQGNVIVVDCAQYDIRERDAVVQIIRHFMPNWVGENCSFQPSING